MGICSRAKSDAFKRFYWGFLFVLIDFRFAGIDVLPDIIGYFHFGKGLEVLASENEFFAKTNKINLPLLLLSVFQIYETQGHLPEPGGVRVTFLTQPPLLLVLGIATLIISLFHVHGIFMGIKQAAVETGKTQISQTAQLKWGQYFAVRIASLIGIVLAGFPGIGMFYAVGILIANGVLTFSIMKFMEECERITI